MLSSDKFQCWDVSVAHMTVYSASLRENIESFRGTDLCNNNFVCHTASD